MKIINQFKLSLCCLVATGFAYSVLGQGNTPPAPEEVPASPSDVEPSPGGESEEDIEREFELEEKLPNVVLIITDDQGWGDYGVHGNKLIETPNLDAMAKRSVVWDTFYVSPVCSPTRASLMTGRYNQRTKCLDTYLGRSMMATDEVTIAEALKGSGYATGIFGKWHLGDNYPMRPSDQGFTTSLVHRGGGLAQPADPLTNKRRYTDPVLYKDNNEVQTKGYCTDIFFDAAIDFIKQSTEYQKPFFAYIATNAPHGPFHDVPKDWYDKYKGKDLSSLLIAAQQKNTNANDKLQRIAAMISNIDDNVGKVFKTLEELKITDKTIVIYLTDNGPNQPRYVGKFRGKKSDILEGGIRSPLWIQWPSEFKPATVKGNIAAHIDIMPTIMDACGLGTPEAFEFDGRSLVEKSKDPTAEMKSRPVIIQSHRGATPIRYHHFMVRDGKWKLLNNSGFSKTRLDEEPNFELYDIESDPGESKNLAGDQPDEVKRLLAIYEVWFDSVKQTRIRDKGTPYIIINKEKENPVVLTWQDRIAKGWTISDHGFWKVFYVRETLMDIRVVGLPKSYQKNLSGYTTVLQIGKMEYKSKPIGEQQLAVFESVVVPKGRTTIQAKFVSPDGSEEIPAYQLRLIHR